MTLSVADARVLVGLKPTDTSRDVRLGQLIAAAYEQAADKVGPQTATTVTETARNRCGQLLLDQPPVTAVMSIAGVAAAGLGLRVNRRFGLVEKLPSTLADGDVVVVYTSGYATYPSSIEEGVRLWVKHRWSMESYGTDTYGDNEDGTVADYDGLPNAVRNVWGPYLLADQVIGGFA